MSPEEIQNEIDRLDAQRTTLKAQLYDLGESIALLLEVKSRAEAVLERDRLQAQAQAQAQAQGVGSIPPGHFGPSGLPGGR